MPRQLPNKNELKEFAKHLLLQPFKDIKEAITETPKTVSNLASNLKKLVRTILKPSVTLWVVVAIVFFLAQKTRDWKVLIISFIILIMTYLRKEWTTWISVYRYEQRKKIRETIRHKQSQQSSSQHPHEQADNCPQKKHYPPSQ